MLLISFPLPIEVSISISTFFLLKLTDDITIKNLSLKELDEYWNTHPPTTTTQRIGDDFIDSGNECIMKVPSAVVQGDFNYLINPNHLSFKKIKIVDVTDFPCDKRIFE